MRDADVLLENFRAGVLTRIGYGWDVLHGANPRLIYCAISGFGQTGPDEPGTGVRPDHPGPRPA